MFQAGQTINAPQVQPNHTSRRQDLPLIELLDVSLSYRRKRSLFATELHPVLQGISFPIYPGETVGIVGRNGAGKTTLLKLIAGIISPDHGRIERRTESISMLSYQLGFNRLLTGRENAVHTAMLQGMTRSDIEAKIGDVIAFAGLEDMIDEPLSSYSAGMRSRLGFSVSLQLDPDVLLIDEALGVGDHEFKERSGAAMRARMRSNKTVVVVSHDPYTVKDLCDRAVWIENSQLVMQDIPEKVIHQYHNFDRLTSDLAAVMGRPETLIRANPINRNPVEVMQRLRSHLALERKKQKIDYIEETKAADEFGMEIYIPGKRPILSNLIEEACGQWSWVENTQLIRRGERDSVCSAHEDFERMLYKMGMELKLDPVKLRNSDLYRQLTGLLRALS